MDKKTELRTALGPDYRTALKKLPGAVALLQHQIALGERRAMEAGMRIVTVGRYPLTVEQMALRNYQMLIALDEDLRTADHRYALIGVDDLLVARLRAGIAGRLTDGELVELVGQRIQRFRVLGNTTAEFGSDEWRILARAMCVSELEASARVAERDEGDFTGRPSHPLIANAEAVEDEKPPMSLKRLLSEYLERRKTIGKGRGAETRWTPVFHNLVSFIGHDDARRLTKQNLMDWRDFCLKTLSAKTVSDVYLASVRTILKWAVENDRLEANVAEKVRQEVPKKLSEREQGYTDTEAIAVLRASRTYTATVRNNPATMEAPQTTAAKQWAPILCAFTGARITEITQLRKQDFRVDGGMHVVRITPAAGTVKAGGYRDVPLHGQIIDSGFLQFLGSASQGPLFYSLKLGKSARVGATTVAGRVTEWLQSLKVVPVGVSPNHGWRHRFKTAGRELGISDRVLDAIQGHASKTAGDSYGDVTLRAKYAAILQMPRYDIDNVDSA